MRLLISAATSLHVSYGLRPLIVDQTDGICWRVALGLLQPAFGALVGRMVGRAAACRTRPDVIAAGYGSGELPGWTG